MGGQGDPARSAIDQPQLGEQVHEHRQFGGRAVDTGQFAVVFQVGGGQPFEQGRADELVDHAGYPRNDQRGRVEDHLFP